MKAGPYELDFYFADARLNVETDGYGPHTTPAAFERDRRRDADLVAAYGIRVLRFTWRRLRYERDAVIARLAQALATSPGTTRA